MRRTASVRAIALLAMLLGAAAARAEYGYEIGPVNATAAMVVDVHTGEVLFARNPTLRLAPASTTKLLTGLIAMRMLSPEASLSVSKYASTMPPSKAGLRAGWLLSARDLLYALLLRSSNDASVVIAEGVSGSVPNFARLMNATARSLGATDSNFVTPNGLPAPGHLSTVRDMAVIMRHALLTPGMRDILSTPTAVIQPRAGSRQRIALRSTNRLLWRDDLNVIGKTGWTREARHCFVGAASAGDREVIVAVLGSNALWKDVETLAAYGLERSTPDPAGRQAGWQQAAGVMPGSAWRRPAVDEAVVEAMVAQPRPVAGRGKKSTRTASASGRARVASASARAHAAQGDAVEPARAALRYSVNLGRFSNRAKADQVRQAAAKIGYRVQVKSSSGTYSVSVPNLPSRDAARQVARKLGRKLRVDPTIVAAR